MNIFIHKQKKNIKVTTIPTTTTIITITTKIITKI
jgi:hypothetical protein